MLCLTGGLWIIAARNAADRSALGLALPLHLEFLEPLLYASALVLLIMSGLTGLHWVVTRNATFRSVNALPERATSGREWRIGAALGWAMLITVLIPIVLAGDLVPGFWFHASAIGQLALSLLTLLLITLASELAFRGYLYQRLIAATNPSIATLLMSAVYAFISAMHPNATPRSILITFLLGIVLSIAYQRTHAIWLGWGLHFGWAVSTGVLFGLPVVGVDYSSLIYSRTEGAPWLTGGIYGPEAAVFTAIVALLSIPILYALTRDLAWTYTHSPIVAAGYAMDVAPPAEHTAMEQAAAAKPAPLVQILATTPSASSTLPAIEEHLRSTAE